MKDRSSIRLQRCVGWFLSRPAALRSRKRQKSTLESAIRATVGNLTFRCDRDLGDDAEVLLANVVNALNLIFEVDPRRFHWIWSRKPDILVMKTEMPRYWSQFGTYLLPYEEVMANNRAEVAASIIHEAVHARMHSAGLEWWPDLRNRMEARCYAEELLFFTKLQRAGWNATRRIAWTAKQIDDYRRAGTRSLDR